MDQEFLFDAERQRKPQVFELPEGGSIDASDLRKAGPDAQAGVMRHWFYSNFEDPAENTPYESAEGGYQYIWGGPYDPYEELDSKFSGIVPGKVIEEVADALSRISAEWSGQPNSSDSDDYLLRSIIESPEHFEAFCKSMNNVRRLLEAKIEATERQCLLRLLHVNVITALETYLSDNFISSVAGDRSLLRRFIETNPEFRLKKFPISDIFKVSEEIEQQVRTYLIRLVWHRLEHIKPMFRDTLGVDFPSDPADIFKAIEVRHDLVHRNGRTEDGREHVLDENDIKNLVDAAETFVARIECQQRIVEFRESPNNP